jgi:processive 1,2-diacylglycerol beta-glucosyltransferase
MSKLKIALVGTDFSATQERKESKGYGGVTYYRLIKPLLENKNDKFEFTYHAADLIDEAVGKSTVQFWQDFVGRYDMFVVKHIDNPEGASNLLFFAKKYGKKVILDLDDNLFETREDQPAHQFYKRGEQKRAVVSALISMVDGLFVSTQPLADYYKNHLKTVFNVEIPIFVLPNYNDIKDFDFVPVEKDPNKTVIGWMGSTTHLSDLKVVLKPLQRLLKEVNLMGGLSSKEAPILFKDFDDTLLDRVFIYGGTPSWKGYPELLSKQPWDIAIAPLLNDEFNRGKSHIKWMEYGVYKIPCVASDVYPYSKAITDGEDGFLCDEKQWYYTLRKLINDKDLRKKIGDNAYSTITKELQYKDHYKLWIDALSRFV